MAAYTENEAGEAVEINLRPYLSAIRRHGTLIIGIVAVFVALSVISGLTGPRLWSATITVTVPQPPTNTQGEVVGGVQATPPSVVYSQSTYAKLLTTTTILDMVINKLHLRMSPQDLVRMIKVTAIRDTPLIETAVSGPVKQETEDIANALGDALVAYDSQSVTAELTQGRTVVTSQLAAARQDLQTREMALAQFSATTNLDAVRSTLNQQVDALAKNRQAAEQNKIGLGTARQRLAQVQRELTSTGRSRSFTSTEANSLGTSAAAQLRARLADLTAQRAKLLEQYTPTYPAVLDIQAQIDQTQKALADAALREPRSVQEQANVLRDTLETQRATLSVDIVGMEATDRLLAAAISGAEQQIGALTARLAELNAQNARLTRDLDAAKAAYTVLSAKATDALVAQGIQHGFVRVADRAAARPVPRGITSRAVSAGVLGLFLGILAAFALEYVRPAPRPVVATSER